jgi:hypothetical protein
MTQTKFASLSTKLVQGRLLLPGDEGFEESLQRWSLTCVKPAVRQTVVNPQLPANQSTGRCSPTQDC